MGIKSVPDIFQSKMEDLMMGIEYIRPYLDDLLVLNKGTLDDHLRKLDSVFYRLHSTNLRVHVQKSKFCRNEIEYLVYIITRDGIKPQYSNIQSILKLKTPTTVRELRSVLGLIQYYRDLWPQRIQTLAPLTDLIKKDKTKKSTSKILW